MVERLQNGELAEREAVAGHVGLGVGAYGHVCAAEDDPELECGRMFVFHILSDKIIWLSTRSSGCPPRHTCCGGRALP